MGFITTDDKYRYRQSWRVTVVCINPECNREWILQYPVGPGFGQLGSEIKNKLNHNSRCVCGSWYCRYKYPLEGV